MNEIVVRRPRKFHCPCETCRNRGLGPVGFCVDHQIFLDGVREELGFVGPRRYTINGSKGERWLQEAT